jgi:hypothetical protein
MNFEDAPTTSREGMQLSLPSSRPSTVRQTRAGAIRMEGRGATMALMRMKMTTMMHSNYVNTTN